MRRRASVAVATVGLLAASIAGAAPAAADHLVGILPSQCFAGPLSFDIPDNIVTKLERDVSIVTLADGTMVATCTFKGLPKRGVNVMTELPWERPKVGHVDTNFPCILTDYPGRPFGGRGEWHAESATATWLAGSKARSVCTFDPSYWDAFPV